MLTPEERQRIREEAYERAKAEAEAKQEVENKQGCAMLLGYGLGTILAPIILIVIIILMVKSC